MTQFCVYGFLNSRITKIQMSNHQDLYKYYNTLIGVIGRSIEKGRTL